MTKTFGKLITETRKKLGLSKQDVVDRVGGIINLFDVSRIELDCYFDYQKPDAMLVTAIAFALQIDEQEAFDAADCSWRNMKSVREEYPDLSADFTKMKEKIAIASARQIVRYEDSLFAYYIGYCKLSGSQIISAEVIERLQVSDSTVIGDRNCMSVALETFFALIEEFHQGSN
ncbi:MAG: hypothetical protein WBB28_01935 [Crinalium sp.]